ncbi:MAG: hypothetical protein ACYDIE_01490 [Candidatus Krumholzibacteriia bacterium]
MKRNRTLRPAAAGFACLTVCLGLAAGVMAQLTPDVSVEAAVLNKYLWRGAVMTDGWVVQPSVTVGLGGLEIGAWGNLDLDDVNEHRHDLSEIDYTATFTRGVGLVEFSAGALHYAFPPDDCEATTELFVGGSVAVLLSPSLGIYRDIDESDGTYVLLGASHALPVGTTALDLAASLGWGDQEHNGYNYGAATAGPADAALMLSMDIAVTPLLTVRPTLGYTSLVTAELRDAAAEPDNFLFGVVLAGGF